MLKLNYCYHHVVVEEQEKLQEEDGKKTAEDRASTWKEISFQKEILAIGRKKEGNENFKEIGRKFDGEMRNLKTM